VLLAGAVCAVGVCVHALIEAIAVNANEISFVVVRTDLSSLSEGCGSSADRP